MGQIQCLALIVCDQVIEDSRTSNKSLIGLFNAIITPVLPLTKSLYVFVSVSGMDQLLPLALKVVAPPGLLAEMTWNPGENPQTQPEVVHELVIQMPNLELPQAGVYFFELWQGEELLAKRGFSVMLQAEDGAKPVARG